MNTSTIQLGTSGEGYRQFRRLTADETELLQRKHGKSYTVEFEDWLRGGGAELVLQLACMDDRGISDWIEPEWRWLYASTLVSESIQPGVTTHV